MDDLQDRSFDGLADKLNKNIYGTPKGLVRLNVLWQDMNLSIPELEGPPLTVLDAGGGIGQVARLLARQGHSVTHFDVSREMLDLAEAENKKAGLDGSIKLVHSSIQDLHKVVDFKFDLIVFHGVIEWLAKPKETFKELLRFLKPGGYLSLLYYNVDRHILKCGVNAQFNRIITGKYIFQGKRKPLTPINPLGFQEVAEWVDEFGLDVLSKAGIRIFYGLFPNKDMFEDRLPELEASEKAYSRQEPFASIGMHTHLVCKGR